MSFTGKEIIALEESGYKCISENCQNKDIRNNGMLCRFSYCYSAQSALVLDYYFDRSVYCINEYLSNKDVEKISYENLKLLEDSMIMECMLSVFHRRRFFGEGKVQSKNNKNYRFCKKYKSNRYETRFTLEEKINGKFKTIMRINDSNFNELKELAISKGMF